MKRTPIKPKAKKCSECGTEFMPFKSTDTTCASHDCKTAWALKVVRKRNAAKEKEQRKSDHEKRKSLKTLSQLESEAKKSFQKFIRLRDLGLPCISCGTTNQSDRAGGHYFSAGVYSGLIFDEDNCHSQCNTYCNKCLSGNLIEYRKGLISKIGESALKRLETASNETRSYKYTRQELIDIKKKYDLKIKELCRQQYSKA